MKGLSLLIILSVLGFIITLVVSALSAFVPFFGNYLWAFILIGLAVVLAWLKIGNTSVFKGERVNVTISTLLIIPALALIFLAFIGQSIGSLFGSLYPVLSSVTASSTTGAPLANIVIPSNAFTIIVVALLMSAFATYVFTRPTISKGLNMVLGKKK